MLYLLTCFHHCILHSVNKSVLTKSFLAFFRFVMHYFYFIFINEIYFFLFSFVMHAFSLLFWIILILLLNYIYICVCAFIYYLFFLKFACFILIWGTYFKKCFSFFKPFSTISSSLGKYLLFLNHLGPLIFLSFLLYFFCKCN